MKPINIIRILSLTTIIAFVMAYSIDSKYKDSYREHKHLEDRNENLRETQREVEKDYKDLVKEYNDLEKKYKKALEQKALEQSMTSNFYMPYMPVTPSQGYSSSSGSSGGTSTYTETCSFCKGKGTIVGSKSPTFGNMDGKFCSECNQHVHASHSHDRCPSCGGRGYITRIK